MSWQPIATVPTDGRRLLFASFTGRTNNEIGVTTYIMQWAASGVFLDPEGELNVQFDYSPPGAPGHEYVPTITARATHWMPLEEL